MKIEEFYLERLQRFFEVSQDFEADGHDLSKTTIVEMEKLGLLRNCGFGRHEITQFGEYVLAREAEEPFAYVSAIDISFLEQRREMQGAWRLNLSTSVYGVIDQPLFLRPKP